MAIGSGFAGLRIIIPDTDKLSRSASVTTNVDSGALVGLPLSIDTSASSTSVVPDLPHVPVVTHINPQHPGVVVSFRAPKGSVSILNSDVGAGKFGDVKQGLYTAIGSTVPIMCAVKSVPLRNISENSGLFEAHVHSKVSHSPAVVTLLDIGKDNEVEYLVLDFYSSSLKPDTLHKEYQTDPVSRSFLIRDIARALCDVHAAGSVHADLKPDNILVKSGLPCNASVYRHVLCDFGNACDGNRSFVSGTKRYLPFSDVEQTPKTDMYMFGAVIGDICFGLKYSGDDPDRRNALSWNLGISDSAKRVQRVLNMCSNYDALSMYFDSEHHEIKAGESAIFNCISTVLSGRNTISFEEQIQGIDLLVELLAADPDKRLSAAQVLDLCVIREV